MRRGHRVPLAAAVSARCSQWCSTCLAQSRPARAPRDWPRRNTCRDRGVGRRRDARRDGSATGTRRPSAGLRCLRSVAPRVMAGPARKARTTCLSAPNRARFPFSARTATATHDRQLLALCDDGLRLHPPRDAARRARLADNDEVYSLTAFLLHANELIAADAVIDAATLPKVAMPARQYFVPDARGR